MAAQLFTNNATSTLLAGISAGATTATLASGGGALFPAVTGSDWFVVTLITKTGSTETTREIVKCTARTGDVLTITRAQEGTSAASFLAGATVSLRETAGTFDNFVQDAELTAEALARANADTALSGLITSEASTRAGADTTNATAIATETTNRTTADSTHTALTTGAHGITAAGAALTTAADAPAQRTALGLGSLATQSGTFSGTSSGTNTGDQTNIAGNAATVTTNANLTGPVTSIGNATTIADAELSALAGLTSAADKLPYFTGSGTAALQSLTATDRAFMGAANVAAQRTALGLVIGTDVAAFSALANYLPLAGGTMTGTLTSAIGTIVANTPAISITQTWNNSGVTFKGLFVNITPTASVASSSIFDFQISGTSYFSMNQGGTAQFTGNITGQNGWSLGAGGNVGVFTTSATGGVKWSSTGTYFGTVDLGITRNIAGRLEGNNGTAGTYADSIWRAVYVAPSSANGQELGDKCLTEVTTIAAAATTDTAIQMPAGALVTGVDVRVTTAITCTSTFTVGDSGNATRFGSGISKAVNTTGGNLVVPFVNASALSIRITPDTTPSDATGRVRVTVFYRQLTHATS